MKFRKVAEKLKLGQLGQFKQLHASSEMPEMMILIVIP